MTKRLRACRANHPHAIWELSDPTWTGHSKFHDRWLPGTMRHIADITRRCKPRMRHRRTATSAEPNGGSAPNGC